jgi:hypothetical protein
MTKKEFSGFSTLLSGYLIAIGHTPSSFFGEKEESGEENLGNGYTLRPIELTEEESASRHISGMKYSHIYHNGLKVSDSIFRKGGMCNGFKDGYCQLIHYRRITKGKDSDGFSSGDHVIINEMCETVLAGLGSLDHPYHIGGHIGKLKRDLYDLRTGDRIAPYPSESIKGKNYLIINHVYSHDDKELPLGVYMVNLYTAEITKIDETR